MTLNLKQIAQQIAETRQREKGVTTVEYAVMIFLIAIAVMSATPGIATAVNNVFTNIASRLTP